MTVTPALPFNGEISSLVFSGATAKCPDIVGFWKYHWSSCKKGLKADVTSASRCSLYLKKIAAHYQIDSNFLHENVSYFCV